MIYLQLFLSFMKIGGFTIGGGYAMIPIIQHEVVDVKKWASEEEMLDYLTIAQSMPGVIGINTATAVGNKVAGKRGALAATCGMVLPSLIVIIIIASIFEQFQKMTLVQSAFNGVRAAVAALIIAAVVRIAKPAVTSAFQFGLLVVTFACIAFLSVQPQIMLIACAAASLAYNAKSAKKIVLFVAAITVIAVILWQIQNILSGHGFNGASANVGAFVLPLLLELFYTFFKIGLFSFGGGYAVISILQHEAVSHAWMTVSEFADIVAISQITPGPIAVNMATFVGYRQSGIAGSIVATVGVCLPSLILVLVVVHFINKFKSSRAVQSVFYGLRPATAGMIAAAALIIAWAEFFPKTRVMDFANMAGSIEFRSIGICAIALVALTKLKANPFIMIGLSAVAGIILWR